MAKLKIRGKELRKLGFTKGKQASLVLGILRKHYKYEERAAVMALLEKIGQNPEQFQEDAIWRPVVKELLAEQLAADRSETALLPQALPYRCFGAEHIEQGALQQMEVAMKLPIVAEGALMPDAHQGYGLPIGGVLATNNAIIPYAVGMDIGCRMCLSIYDLPIDHLDDKRKEYKGFLAENSRFGKTVFEDPMDDEVLHQTLFQEIPLLKRLQQKARQQIGSSGSGNHFVEFGIVDISASDPQLNLPAGQYLGLLSHSGSRGLGATIAQHYTKLARERCLLPREAQSLAWLDLDTAEGQEYWLAMNLAGDYASACHHHIHRRMSQAIGGEALAMVENHHNFAWKEQLADGRTVVVHRKGATPAGQGVLGIIPGSMTAPGFIVRGRGEPSSLSSASHGAGRAMSRRKAKNSFSRKEVRAFLKKNKVELLGGGLDEAPMAYKDIHQVMKSQQDLVDVLGTFQPRLVRMDKD